MKKLGFALKIIAGAFLLTIVMQLVPSLYMIVTGNTDTAFFETTRIGTVIFLIGEITLPLFLLLFYRRKREELNQVMAFHKNGFIKRYLLGFLAGFATFAAIFLVATALNGFSITFVWKNSYIGWLALFLIGYMIQGMTEEILCRGYLQGRLESRFTPFTAMMVNSIFFSLLHGYNDGVTLLALLNLFLFGILVSVARYYLNDLWGIGAFHSAWNFAQGPFFGVAVSGMSNQALVLNAHPEKNMQLINGGSFGIEASLTYFVIFGTCLLGFILIQNQRIKKRAALR